MAWTKEQQRVIDEQGSSILVSAAAGSGKTAVLVERILTRVLDTEHPANIDEFLVVTFTNAAAAQMRDKIASRLEQALAEQPESEHLMRQLLLVNRADITTIDSFCLKLVKEHFALLGLDSAFSIGDPGMMELMKSDVLDKLFDRKYKEAEENGTFTMLVDIFCGDRSDDRLKDEVLKLHRMAASYPVPEQWLKRAKSALDINDTGQLDKAPWMECLLNLIHSKVRDAISLAEQGLRICTEEGGPDKNLVTAESDLLAMKKILSACDYGSMRDAMQISWKRLATCKGDAYNEELVEEYKSLRAQYKDMIKGLDLFRAEPEQVAEQFAVLREYLIPLICLTEEFTEAFNALKNTRKLMEFSDIEHMAYRLVCGGYDEAGRAVPTPVGKDIAERYREIYIDEYQDSNYLQEDILCAVSGMYRGEYNMFMVGDIKQSIYRFRMARPDLFIEKYNRFSDEGKEIKIELKNNFRSRAVVLRAVNYFFYQLMGEDLGGIAYDDGVALVPSKEFPACEKGDISDCTEILLAEQGSEGSMDKLVLEANMVARRIRELVDGKSGLMVYDEERKEYRRAEYRDIVILARSVKGIGEIMYNTLTAQGIPVYLDDPKGYFNAVEIKLIMSLLAVVDNCRQDVPVAAVLLSPLGGLTENELAIVCSYAAKELHGTKDLYDKCICYMTDREDIIAEKLDKIIGIIEELKEDKTVLSISELIWKAINVTGYYTYASAMPMGEKRRANIDMLLEKAGKFEDGYYKGLFHFLRYVEKLKINEVDFGEANILSDDENVVRILSMHKSKGLEYPIVFASGLGRWFNTGDTKENLVLHSDYYLSAMVVNRGRRYKKKSFVREAFKLLLKNESMAEELRVLYVAMTRAKEKLILTGCEADVQRLAERQRGIGQQENILLPYGIRQDARSFMQLLLACMVRYEKLAGPVHAEGMIRTKLYSYEDMAADIGTELTKRGMELAAIRQQAKQHPKGVLYRAYEERFNYRYPYQAYTEIKSKMSISEIKKLKAYDGQGYDVDTEFIGQSVDAEIPESTSVHDAGTDGAVVTAMSGKLTLTGAERGTLVHKFMELLPFERFAVTWDYTPQMEAYRKRLLEENIFSGEELAAVSDRKVSVMLHSGLGKRMIQAALLGKLHREQQFSVGIPASRIYGGDIPVTEDVVIVQGIIDAFFYEGDELVVMDYKTDRADRETLIGRYRAQLSYYADTLEKLTGCRVKERILYSFYLGEEILV